MDIEGYIDFLVGRPRVEISFVILLVSIVTELLFLLLVCKPKHKGKTVTVLFAANIISLFLTEFVFKIIYGAWFISIDTHSFQNFFI